MWCRALVLPLLLLSTLVHAGDSSNAPNIKRVQLQEFTTLTIDIVPDLGTRLVFPFVLDEQPKEGVIPYTMTITNKVFQSDRKDGRNVLVLTAPPTREGGDMSGYLGDMFISVAGYNISARLRTVNDWREHYTDIVFDLSDMDRQNLVDDEVKRRTKALEVEYQNKVAALDKEVDLRALAKVAYLTLEEPEEDRVKEASTTSFDNGDRLILSVDNVVGYGPFSMVPFELEADTLEDIKIIDAKLFVQEEKDSPEQLLPSSLQVKRRIESGDSVRGVIASDRPKIMEYEAIKLVLLTDKGQVELSW